MEEKTGVEDENGDENLEHVGTWVSCLVWVLLVFEVGVCGWALSDKARPTRLKKY